MNYTVLVVEDEYEQRRALIERVEWEKAGFEVIGEAENGVEALDLVEILEPDPGAALYANRQLIIFKGDLYAVDGQVMEDHIVHDRQQYKQIKLPVALHLKPYAPSLWAYLFALYHQYNLLDAIHVYFERSFT